MTQRLSFSQDNPRLQIAWDSTSLGAFKLCPRYYEYSILRELAPRSQSVHLTFGLYYHHALERYDYARSSGLSHEASVAIAVRTALTDSWDRTLNRPWASDHNTKNRETLIRSIVWYLDQFYPDPIETVQLANGNPAVELSFRFDSGYNIDGEDFLLCGHLDRLGMFNGSAWVIDRKTTTHTLTPEYFDNYSPDNQFTIYTLAGHVVYQTDVSGIICDAAQIAVNFTRFQRGPVLRSPSQLTEWLTDLKQWFLLAHHYASEGHWPMNDKSCGMYGGCPYRSICSKAPSVRDQWLAANFINRSWDPLVIRGDI